MENNILRTARPTIYIGRFNYKSGWNGTSLNYNENKIFWQSVGVFGRPSSIVEHTSSEI